MAGVELKALPFNEAIQHFRDKGYALSFNYQDVEKEEHAYNFTVAKVMNRDILNDIRSAVDDAITNGTTLQQFQQTLTPALQAKGWWGTQEMTDPATGETQLVRTGSSSRLRTIYETNMRTAYAAGQWEQVQRTKKVMPFLRYVCVLDGRCRPEHRAWHNTILPVDDPFWKTHTPPNGWRCRCSIQQVAQSDIDHMGLKVSDKAPEIKTRPVQNTRTGEVAHVPVGIDPGFDYNVGMARMKALTPPPLDKPLSTPYAGPASKVPPPAPLPVDKSLLMPDGLEPKKYVDAFLQAFGAKQGEEKIHTDVTGQPLVISDELFRDRAGNLKITKRLRHQYVPLLAQALKDPDEIWHIWHKAENGAQSLVRRYIARYSVDDASAPTMAIFEHAKEGWSGVTAFKADTDKYVDDQRRGVMVYRRPDKK